MLKQQFFALMAVAALIAPAAWAHDHAADEEWQAGDLTITSAFARATLPNAPVAGGFMSIENAGAQDDRLLGASSAVAGKMEIHKMVIDGDVMKMRELPDGVPLPAGERVDLRPGGLHLMFMRLNQPLVEGEEVEVTLSFQQSGEVTLPLQIGPFNAADDHAHGAAVDEHAGH